MPDFGYKVKRFGWLKDYPSIKDYGPRETEEKLISELRLTSGQKNSRVRTILQLGAKTSKREALPIRSVDNRKYCSPIKDQGQLGSCTANMAANMFTSTCANEEKPAMLNFRGFLYTRQHVGYCI